MPGHSFTFYNQAVTDDGTTFDINNGGANVTAPDLNSTFSWQAFVRCPYTGGVAGDYMVLKDGWNDYGPGAVITGAVEEGPGANQITLHVYPNPDFGNPVNPIVVDINPATGAATVKPVVYGDYGSLVSAETTDAPSYVFSCVGYITLTLNHFIDDPDTGSQGTYTLILQKQ